MIASVDIGPELDVFSAEFVKVQATKWLWPGYLPAGKFTLIAGPSGVSKTTLAIAIGATITSAGRWPDGSRSERGSVLLWSGEDGIADTLLPRLMGHGADLSRVYFVGDVTDRGEKRPFDLSVDVEGLALAALQIADLRLIVVDPVILAVRGDSNTNGDVRRALFPLVQIAERTGAALIGVTHFSKGTTGKNPVERVTGSLAFAAAARVVLAVAKVPEDQGGGRVLLRAKSNLGIDGGGFRFVVRPLIVEGAETVRIEWGESLTGSAHELLAATERNEDPDERRATDDAVEFLTATLTDAGGAMERREVLTAGKRAGYSERGIERARTRAGIHTRTTGFSKDRRSVWSMPAHLCHKHPPTSNDIYGGNDGNGSYETAISANSAINDATAGVCDRDSYEKASRGE